MHTNLLTKCIACLFQYSLKKYLKFSFALLPKKCFNVYSNKDIINTKTVFKLKT